MKCQRVLSYCPKLNMLTGSITASLLMCQLEYWFDKTRGEAFYKFLEACPHSHYKKGDSWTEELGFSKAEFRHAFSKIGKVYKSAKAYFESKDPFEGKLYLSYYDRNTRLTYYRRNTDAVKQLVGSKDCELPYTREYKSSISHNQIQEDKKEKIVNMFQEYCPSLKGYAYLSKKCEEQLVKLGEVLEKKGMEMWSTLEQVFKMVEHSDFLCGRLPHSRWHAVLSWILKPDKFFAILAGKYAPFVSEGMPMSPVGMGTRSQGMQQIVMNPNNHYVERPKYGGSTDANLPKSSRFARFIHPFNRVETHNFDLCELEAREQAYQQRLYGGNV